MKTKFFATLFFLLVLFSNVFSLSTSGGQEATIAVANALCAKYAKEQCELDSNGFIRTINTGKATFNCEWNENLNRCAASVESISNYRSSASGSGLPFESMLYSFYILAYFSIFVLFLKFGKSKILKIIYGAKSAAALLLYVIRFFEIILSATSWLILLLFYVLALALSVYAFGIGVGEQRKVKVAIVTVFILEILFFLFMFLIGLSG